MTNSFKTLQMLTESSSLPVVLVWHDQDDNYRVHKAETAADFKSMLSLMDRALNDGRLPDKIVQEFKKLSNSVNEAVARGQFDSARKYIVRFCTNHFDSSDTDFINVQVLTVKGH